MTRVPLKARLAVWYLAKRLKKEFPMTPFPKWVGYVSTLVAVATTAWTALHPGAALPTWIATLTTLLATFSHSATGTGGKG